MSRKLRIAVVQMRCHQAALVGSMDFLAEPFVDAAVCPLQSLSDLELHDDVRQLQAECKETYLGWSKTRLLAILDHLKNAREWPALPETLGDDDVDNSKITRPDIIVFPEYSIPRAHLSLLYNFAAENQCIVIAGTHSPGNLNDEALNVYESCGKQAAAVHSYWSENAASTKSILPIFFGTGEPGKADAVYRFKHNPSVFELSAEGIDARESEFAPLRAKVRNREIVFLPLICSEALQPWKSKELFDLLLIMAYQKDAAQFTNEIRRHSRNQRAVALCNDGQFGGSGIFFASDERHLNRWWLRPPVNGELPAGDGVVVADLDLDALAIQTGVNNPANAFELRGLSAIVSNDTGDETSGFHVAEWLNKRRTYCGSVQANGNPSASTNGPVPFDVRPLLREIQNFLESRSPTPLQRMKLQRLLEVKTHDRHRWDIHGHDIIFGSSRRQLPSLAKLEKQLASRCLSHLRKLGLATNLTPDQAEALRIARKLCADRCGQKDTTSVEAAAWDFFRKVAKQGESDAQQSLADKVSVFLERYEGTSAWLFVVKCSSSSCRDIDAVDASLGGQTPALDLVLVRNARFKPTRAPEASMVARAAREGTVVLYEEVAIDSKSVHPSDFFMVKPTTRSAIAVPIYSTCAGSGVDSELIGVLCLESKLPFTFRAVDATELETEVYRLAEDLVFIQEHRRHQGSLVWRPQSSGWDLAALLGQFCHHLTSALFPGPRTPGFGCTVWFAEHKTTTSSPNAEAYARGASTFDSEYVSERALPIYAVQADDSSLTRAPSSFTGKVILHAPGDDSSVLRRSWEEEVELFRRPQKAKRLELKTIIAAPISLIDAQGTYVDSSGLPAFDRECGWWNNLGAFSCYTFHTEGDNSDTAAAMFTNAVIIRICDLLGQFIYRAREISKRIASTSLLGKLKVESLSGKSVFNLIRVHLMDILESEGCSIFASEEGGARLQCVSTSGIKRNGVSVHEADVNYKCNGHGSSHRTIELFLREGSQRGLRVNFEPIPERSESSDESQKQVRFIEGFVLADNEHRRLLAIRVDDREGNRLGIIRLVRSLRQKPFVDGDELMLQGLADVAVRAFQGRTNESQPGDADDLEEVARNYPFLDSVGHQWELRSDGIRRSMLRIDRGYPQYPGWNRRRIETLIQDVVAVFRPFGAFIASLRMVSRHPEGKNQLKLHSFFSTYSLQPLDERYSEPLREREWGWGWQSLSDGAMVEFNGTSAWFNIIAPEQERVVKGLTAPILIHSESGPARGVLSVDFERGFRFEPMHLRVIAKAALKLNHFAVSQGQWSDTSRLAPSNDVPFAVASVLGGLVDHAFKGNKDVRMSSFALKGLNPEPDSRHEADVARISAAENSPPIVLRGLLRRKLPSMRQEPDLGSPGWPEITDVFERLHTLDAKLDVSTGDALLPLHIGPFRVGEIYLRTIGSGERNTSRIMNMAHGLLRLSWQWNLFAAKRVDAWSFADSNICGKEVTVSNMRSGFVQWTIEPTLAIWGDSETEKTTDQATSRSKTGRRLRRRT